METQPVFDLSTFQGRVLALVRWSGLRPARFGRLAGLSKSHVGQILRGSINKLRDEGIAKVCELTGASRGWLSFGDGSAPTEAAVRERCAEVEKASKEQSQAA